MAFSHPTRHLPHLGRELFILMIALFLLMISLMIINLVRHLPQERAVPQPVLAGPAVHVHFSRLQGSQSITEPTSRALPTTLRDTPLKAALAQLLAGPSRSEQAAGFYSEIPKGTELLGVSNRNGIVTVNLSHEFTIGGGATSMIQRVNELKDTIYAVEGKTRVQIAIEGKPIETLGGEGLEIN